MGKEAFLNRLEWLLSDISQEEREEAMAFYYSYFEEAGAENEAFVIAELGSPEKVAEAIKRDLGMVAAAGCESTQEQAYQSENGAGQNQQTYTDRQEKVKTAEKKKEKLILALILIIVFLMGPGLLGVILGPLATMLGLTVAFVAVTVSMFVVGFVFGGLGIVLMTNISMAAGLVLIGAGLLTLALAMIFLLGCKVIFGKVYPWLWNMLRSLWKKICGLWGKFWNKKGARAV